MKRAVVLIVAAVLAAWAPAAAKPRDAATKSAPAQFSPAELSADHPGSSILAIPAPGRYAIRAKSASGARIELVDMIAGPVESAGQPGLRDGRIDALLDRGSYKLRVVNAKGAAGVVKLSADPFVEAEAKRPTLAAGRIEAASLGDLQQRSFIVEVGASGSIGVEAAGRSLHDLRLWREDGDLVDVPRETAAVEPKAGHPLTLLRLRGTVAPGRYVVTAYGGEKLPWADGDLAQPLLVRLDAPTLLAAGAAEGVIGPFGAARFEAPPSYNAFRLELPEIAPARLEAQRGKKRAFAGIDKSNREPVATAFLDADDKQTARLEISGREGQAFSLRAVRQANSERFDVDGPHLVLVDVAGEGADEVPATALLARVDGDNKGRVLAADLPRIGAGQAFRRKFNLRGPTSLLFEATGSGPVAVTKQGVGVRATIKPAVGDLAPRADGKRPGQYDLQAGFYLLTLEPVADAVGVLDLTLGPPGLTPQLSAPPPPRAVISFGVPLLSKDGTYLILANVAPSLLTGPRAVALPADLSKAPLPLLQQTGEEISLPVRMAEGATLVVQDDKGAAVPFTLGDDKTAKGIRAATLNIAAPEKPRALGVSALAPTAAPEPAEPSETGKALSVSAGKPAFFDLGRNETKAIRFEAPQGGLYRIETLGRLRTALEVGTPFSPALDSGEDNGPGHNALVTAFLRAGPYRAAVTAKDSAGRLGLSVAPAALVATPAIPGDGEARTTLDAGKGAVVPFDIPKDGVYRLEVLGLSANWQARLEDADGWPLAKPGEMTRLTRRFDKGAYRLVVLPGDVEARMVARLTPVVAQPPLAGHGPHPLPFDAPQKLQWREPAAKDAPRDPDVWRFALAGDADVDLAIGDGMIAEVFRGSESVGRAGAGRKFAKKLAAGDYRVEARALSRDDRLDYGIALSTPQLQPGAPRRVEPPATLPFALAADRIVDLSSFGDRDMLATLKTEDGTPVEQIAPRADDWNFALSRRLPAGSYLLELAEVPGAPQAARDGRAGDEGGEETEEADSAPANAEAGEAPAEAETPTEEEAPPGVEIRLGLPREIDAGALPAKGSRKLAGPEAQFLALPEAPEGALFVVAAQSAQTIALALERRAADGSWRAVATEHGSSPLLAWPAAKTEQRIVVWPIGGAAATIELSARIVERRGRGSGEIALEPVADLPTPLCVGLAALPGASVVDVALPGAGLIAGSAPGAPLLPVRAGPLARQGDRLWLAARGACREGARVAALDWTGTEIALDLAPGQRAELPPLPAPKGKARIWVARAAEGVVGLDAGRGMAFSEGETLALDGGAGLKLWSAGTPGAARVTLRALDLDMAAPQQVAGAYRGLVAPRTAQPLEVSRNSAALELDLPAHVAAFSADGAGLSVAAGDAPAALVEHRAGEKLLLINLSDAPAPVRVAVAADKAAPLAAGTSLRGFHGAAGRIALPVAAQKGDRLVVAGGDAIFVAQSGGVARGALLTLDGPGELVIDHKPGLVAAWLERDGKGPWPATARRAVAPPLHTALSGVAMGFALHSEKPALLHVRANAPAILAFAQGARRETEAFAAGVEFHRYVDAGDAALDLYPAQDGTLSGMLDVSAEPVIVAHEGINDPVTLAPGAAALFTFETTRDAEIGVGLRAAPDLAQARLLDARGATIGEGVAQMRKLPPGRYFVEARAPVDAPLSVLRLAIVGTAPPPAGPPEEVVADFLQKAGLKKAKR